MSGYRYFISAILITLLLFSPSSAYVKDIDAVTFKRGVSQYRNGSYYSAIDYFEKLLRNERSPYFNKALLMLSKVYLNIGRKTGRVKFLWRSLSYLQLYFSSSGKADWDYYQTKAKIFESLKFYERALTLYRISFLKAKSREQRIATTMGILRNAVFLKRYDIIDTYFILISTQKLNPLEEKEVRFIKGLILFFKGNYTEASKYFLPTYRQFESYLLENPEYYLLVAENLYRTGNYNLSEQLFRRIVSLTNDRYAIRKALLRLGDIEVRRGNTKLAVTYYYSIVSDYPKSDEAIIAKLKCISLMDDPRISYELSKTGVDAFKDPIKYVASTLVGYRSSYIGIFALADFGKLVLKLQSPELFDRLSWEISLIFPQQVKFEQREFLRQSWEPYILNIPYKRVCQLYRANPELFHKVFGLDVLISISKTLKRCGERKLRLKLLKFIVSNWKTDENRLLLAQALFEVKDFSGSLNVLGRVKRKDCRYYKLFGKDLLMLNAPIGWLVPKLSKSCSSNDPEFRALTILHMIKRNRVEKAYNLLSEELLSFYGKSATVKLALNRLSESLMMNGDYRKALKVLLPLSGKDEKNCYLNSLLLISLTRVDKMEEAEKVYGRLKGCRDSLSRVAATVYSSELIAGRKIGTLGKTQ